MKRIVFAVLFCVIAFTTTLGGVVATHKEILRYFGMPAYMGAVPENIQAEILQALPVGSSPRDVEYFLMARRIGRDRGSICSTEPNSLDVRCQLGIDHHFWELIRETFTLAFTFDSHGKLREITVRSAFSCPLRSNSQAAPVTGRIQHLSSKKTPDIKTILRVSLVPL